MSEQLFNVTFSGTATATRPVSNDAQAAEAGGKTAPGDGKALPEQAVERPKPALEEMVRQLNIVNRTIGRDLRFQVDLDKGSAVIQVLDRETGELIRQIPPDKASPYIGANGALEIRLYDELV